MRNKILTFLFVPVILLMITVVDVSAQSTNAKQQISFETFEAKLREASPDPQILDARSAEEFDLNHLKGAVNVNASDDALLQQQIAKLEKNKPVFVYSINNGRSGQLAKKLRAQNFKDVYELPGGISKWIGAGKPVESKTGNGLTVAEYGKLVKSDKLVLVDVHSKFCRSCKRLSPIVDSVARENSNSVKLVKLELFDNKQLGKDLNIESIPTLILYKGDKIVWRRSGLTTRAVIDEAIKKQL